MTGTDSAQSSVDPISQPYAEFYRDKALEFEQTIKRLQAQLAAQEAEATRLRLVLVQIQDWDCLNPPDPRMCADHPWLRRLVDNTLSTRLDGADVPAASTGRAECNCGGAFTNGFRDGKYVPDRSGEHSRYCASHGDSEYLNRSKPAASTTREE
jgi:hypothetical protein